MKGRAEPHRDHLETARRWSAGYVASGRPEWAWCMRVVHLLVRDLDRVTAALEMECNEHAGDLAELERVRAERAELKAELEYWHRRDITSVSL